MSEIRIEGIRLVAELGRGAKTIVYRVERDGRAYALKIVAKAGDRDDATAAFAREAALLASLQHPGLVDIYEVGQTDGRPYLIMELVDGHLLSQLIREERLDSIRVAAIGEQIAAALGVAHAAGLAHRDVKPDNILIESDGRVRLIDFGLAAKVKAQIDDEAVGTFLYSAPEQTGVLRRPVDGRADLYALGVVLYESVTGEVPFTAQETGELIRMHLTAPVPDPRRVRPEVEPSLAAIIMRLMAKDPDDRYASADEVCRELSRVASGDQRPAVASLGRDGSANRTPLVGRTEELGRLRSCWDGVVGGAGRAVLVTGATGIGKSRLVDALASHVMGSNHPILRGAGSVDHRTPLAPLLDAIDHHLAAVTALSEAKRAQAVATLLEVGGPATRLLARLVPRLGKLVGLPAEKVTAQRPWEVDEDRFVEVVIRFLFQLADASGGAVLLLEDAQAWDGATHELVRRLATALSGAHLLLLVTARDDDVAKTLDLPGLLGPAMAMDLHLGPLAPPGVSDLVKSRLGGRVVPESLVTRVVSFSGGNPLIVVEYLRAVLEGGAVRPSWGTWILDEAALDRLQLPADIFELTLRRVEQLRPRTRGLLVVAAAIGNQFALDLVETVLLRWKEEPEGGAAGSASVEVSEALTEAIGHRLIEPVGSRYAFPHERIRKALLARLDESHRRALHQHIGESMEAASALDTVAVYEIAQHYLNGQPDRNPRRLFRAIVAAGERALAEYASAQAYDFFARAESAAAAAGIDLDARFHQSYGMAATRVGEHQVAQEQAGRALEEEHDSLRRAALYSWLAESHHAQWEGQQAVEVASRGLAEIGRPLPHHPAALVLTTLGRMLGARLWQWVPLRWRLTRGDRRARDQVEVRLLSVIKQSASYAMRMPLAIVTSLRSSYVTARLGPGPERVDDQLIKAVSASALGRMKSCTRLLEQALAEATALGDPAIVAQVHLMRSLAIDAQRPPNGKTGDIFKETLLGHGQWLQASDYLLLASQVGLFEIMRGHLAEATTWYERALRRIPARGAYGNPTMALGASIAALAGNPAEAAARLRGVQAFADGDPTNMTTRVNAALTAAHVALEQGELGAPFEAAIAAFEALKLGPRRVYVIQRTYWVFKAFGRLAQAASATDADRAARLEAARCAVGELRRAGAGTLYGSYATVAEAWFDHLCGKQKESLVRLANLDADPEDHNAPLVDYEAARVRSRVLLALGRREEAIRHAECAMSLSTCYGWKTRARWIGQEFDVGTSSYSHHSASVMSTEVRGTQSGAQLRRLQAVHQVSLAASAVLDTRQLCRVALDETLRILAAERAFLFLVNAEDNQLMPYLGRDAAGTDLATLTGYGASLVERVRDSSHGLVVTGCEQGAALGSQSTLIHGLRSIIVAPVLLREQLLGVMYLDSRAARGIFTTDDLEILSAISHQVAVTFETARAARLESDIRTAQRERDLAEMLRLAMIELSGTLDPDEVIRRMFALIRRAAPVETWSLVHQTEERTVMILGAASGMAKGSEPEAEWLLSLSEPSSGTRATTDLGPFAGPLAKEPYAWMALPLQSRGQGRGVLVVATAKSTSYTDGEVRIAATLASQAMAAYDNARLFRQIGELATRDALTGLYNRRHFFALASSPSQEVQREPRASAAVMVDIDLFKKINDTYGHGVGDEVIREVASRLSRCLREDDVICRYGGEEFAVLLRGTSAQQADAVAARLHSAVGARPIDTAAGPLVVTVSVGVTSTRLDPADAQALLNKADQALYEAKRGGRNQVVSAQAEPPQPLG
jgi:eukaryotic-like serine/threonine-protein kinase